MILHNIDEFGNEFWSLNGKLHREDGPAFVSYRGTQYWAKHGMYHREDGPAVVYTNNDVEWWLHDAQFTFNNYCAKINLDDATVLELKLKYG